MKNFTLLVLALFAFQFVIGQNHMINTQKKTLKSEEMKDTPTNVDSKDVMDYSSAIWYEDFDGGAMPAGFSLIDNSTNGSQDWVWTNVGPTGPYATAPLESTTAANGWALYDSDSYCGPDDDAYMVLPEMDLSGYNNVKLTFEQLYRNYYDFTYIEVSNDGANWTEFQVNPDILVNSSTENGEVCEVNISSVAGDQPHVFIRFHFVGACGYSWQVDDIAIFELAEYDMILDKLYPEFYYNNGGPYSKTPVKQRMDVMFGADATNFGFSEQTNVALNVAISDGTTTVFDETGLAVANFASETSDSLELDVAFSPDPVVADYEAIFTVVSDNTDVTPDNNIDTLNFSITARSYARWFEWNSSVMPQNYTGSADGDFVGFNFVVQEIDTVKTLAVFLHPNTTEGGTIIAGLYTNDADPALVAESEEYDLTVTDIENGWVYLDFEDLSGDDLILDPVECTDYIVGVASYWGTGEIIYGGDNSSFHAFNYTSYLLQADGWGWIERVPMFELHMDYPVSTDEVVKVTELNIYPNPAADISTISFNLDRNTNVQVKLYDFTGKLVYADDKGILPEGNREIQIDLNDLSNGIYNLQVITNGVATTQKLIIAR